VQAERHPGRMDDCRRIEETPTAKFALVLCRTASVATVQLSSPPRPRPLQRSALSS
jgi:hypothetical protein